MESNKIGLNLHDGYIYIYLHVHKLVEKVSQVGRLDEGLYQPVLLPIPVTLHPHPGLSQWHHGREGIAPASEWGGKWLRR